MAERFEFISSRENYSDAFRALIPGLERTTPSFEEDIDHYYNAPFSGEEFSSALDSTKNSAPGPDSITYQLLKNSDPTMKTFLLKQ